MALQTIEHPAAPIPEIDPPQLSRDAIWLGPNDHNLTDPRFARDMTVAFADWVAGKHRSTIDTNDALMVAYEAFTNAIRPNEGRTPQGLAIEFSRRRPIDDPRCVGSVALHLSDNYHGWHRDIRPTHSFNEAETQYGFKAQPGPVNGSESEFSEDLNDLSELLPEEELKSIQDARLENEGQTNRGLQIILGLTAEVAFYRTADGKTIRMILPAYRQRSTRFIPSLADLRRMWTKSSKAV